MKVKISFFVVFSFFINDCIGQFSAFGDGGKCFLEPVIVIGGNCLDAGWDDYAPVFIDDFNGTQIDEEQWYLDGVGGQCMPSHDLSYICDQVNKGSAYVSGGTLKLKAQYQPGSGPEYSWGNPNTVSYNYTSGFIHTKEAFGPGKFEARIKLPRNQSLWPAFWTYGWCADEIDIFEFSKSGNKILNPYGSHLYGSIHSLNNGAPQYYDCTSDWDKDQNKCNNKVYDIEDIEIDDPYGFHIYTMTWDEYVIRYYIDGSLLGQWHRYH